MCDRLRSGVALAALVLLATTAPGIASAQWSPDSTVNLRVSFPPAVPGPIHVNTAMAHTGQQIVVIAWHDGRTVPARLFGQRLSHNGFRTWDDAAGRELTGAAARPVDTPTLVPDGAGGFYAAWADRRNVGTSFEDIYCERFDANGVALWNGGDGVLVSASPGREGNGTGLLRAVPDGLGGLILIWFDDDPVSFNDVNRLNRLAPTGTLLWGPGGVTLSSSLALGPVTSLVGDGAGGGLVAFHAAGGATLDLRAQRFGPAGSALWGPTGVPVCAAPGHQFITMEGATPDGAGGWIVAWRDFRSGSGSTQDVYAQRIDGSGNALWAVDGVLVSTVAYSRLDPKVVSDLAGGAYVVWPDARTDPSFHELFGQRMGPGGARLWNPVGIPMATQPPVPAGQFDPWLVLSDGGCGGRIGWAEPTVPFGIPNIRMVRFDAAGQTPWGTRGVAVSTTPSPAFHMVTTGGGAPVVAWTDGRNPGPDVYAQRVRCDGALGDDDLPPPPGGTGVDDHPITFSVNGPVDPHTDGIRYARGTPPPAAPPALPGTEISYGVRTGPVPQATGLLTPRPGDLMDFADVGIPDEAVVFQSAPPVPPADPYGGAPDGTNNQIIAAPAAGLVSGLAAPIDFWTARPPYIHERDNIDALSFGEDYFPPAIVVGPDPNSPFPPAPLDFLPWAARTPAALPPMAEPVVISQGAGMSFRFSVDPWAIGAPGTAVRTQSGGADVGLGTGPWESPGGAAADVFATPALTRVGGVTVGAAGNTLVHDHPTTGHAPGTPPLDLMEDDIDALECVGSNTAWNPPAAYRTGSVHVRTVDVAADLPLPHVSAHEPAARSPVFFSVSRNSPGAAFSAVRSQFVIDGGAAADIFVMVKEPGTPPGVGTNLLFIENKEIGLWALSADDGSAPEDYTDDLDGLILNICPELRDTLATVIQSILDNRGGESGPWTPYVSGDCYLGVGMTLSIVKYLIGSFPPGCIQVGFSVTSDVIGLSATAVDWEAGPVAPAGGISSVAGDVFYAAPTGDDSGPNYLWFEETAFGLDPGTWINGTSTDFSDLSDNLDGLDSIEGTAPSVGVGDLHVGPVGPLALDAAMPNPSSGATMIRFRTGAPGQVRMTVVDILGRTVATLVDGWTSGGRQAVTWHGRSDAGGPVAPGLYFVRASAGGVTRTLKLVRTE